MENVFFKLSLEKELRSKVKKEAINQDTTMNNLIIEYIKKGLTGNKEGKIKSRVINHEMLGYDPERKGSLENIIGTAKVDNAENIDVNELIDSIHYKKELY